MSERQLQFRVGLFAIVALATLGAIIFVFGEFRTAWQPHYTVAVHFPSAPGVFVGSPVTMSGVKIGQVSDIRFDARRGGVTVLVDIEERYKLHEDSQARLSRSLLGDSSIEFTPGVRPGRLASGSLLEGSLPADPMQIVQDVRTTLNQTLRSFDQTSREWRELAQNVNALLETNHGHLGEVVERAAEALSQLTVTLQTANQTLTAANRLLSDPEHQESLRKTILALPRLAEETHQTITAVRRTMQLVDRNLDNLNRATAPLADRTVSIADKLDRSLGHIEKLSAELSRFTQLVMQEDGSLKQFATNPQLYRSLDQSATSLAVLLKNLEPVVQDLRIFSDKIARHPELIGVSGAIKGSSGLKELPVEETRRAQTPRPPSLLRRR
ncbi:MAG: MCE family protein [Planctomycetes bacterium]|nr:MCE family protein [Planctomycetota bacterium]